MAESEDPAEVEEYLREMAGDSRAKLRVAMIPAAARRGYKLSATPITLVVTIDGTVEQPWSGLWGDPDVARAGSVFGVSFSQHLLTEQ